MRPAPASECERSPPCCLWPRNAISRVSPNAGQSTDAGCSAAGVGTREDFFDQRPLDATRTCRGRSATTAHSGRKGGSPGPGFGSGELHSQVKGPAAGAGGQQFQRPPDFWRHGHQRRCGPADRSIKRWVQGNAAPSSELGGGAAVVPPAAQLNRWISATARPSAGLGWQCLGSGASVRRRLQRRIEPGPRCSRSGPG